MCRLIILTLNKTQNVFIDVVYLITQQKQQEKKENRREGVSSV